MTKAANTPKPPQCEKRPIEKTIHGITRVDDYDWLRADNWQEVMREPDKLDSDIRAYLEEENAYTQQFSDETKDLQDCLFEEMKGRIKEDDSAPPSKDGSFAYYTSFVEGGQHPRYCRKPIKDDGSYGEEELLLDGDQLAKGTEYFQFGAIAHSPCHKFLIYTADLKGSELYTAYVKDLTCGKLLDDTIADTAGGADWAADSQTIYYVKRDDNHRPAMVYRHYLGQSGNDELVFHEEDPAYFINVGRTTQGDQMIIHVGGHETSESYLVDAKDPNAKPVLIAAREAGVEYEVEVGEDKLYILTNLDAEDFKIVTAPIDQPSRANWEDFIPHEAGRLIVSQALLKHHHIRLERFEGLPRIIIHDLKTSKEQRINFDEEAYSLGLSTGYEFDTSLIRFTYASMTTPSETYDYDLRSKKRSLLKRQEVPSGHEPKDYVTRRIMAKADDGQEVPISLLYKKDTPLDGTAPLLLYGYGSYGITIPASFSTNRLSLVDRGFVYAIAHIRGSKAKGYDWYKQGKTDKKMNTFDDFIACARHLCAEKISQEGRIFAHGGSAGGMLMGAVVNKAAALFGGIIAEVPFVDCLNTILDDSLPLTPPEWPEWGNPIEDKEAYDIIASYSPYDNVKRGAYPPMFINGGLTDPRVTYWEPAKWAAKLRAHKHNDAPLYLKINMAAGHGGASGRFDYLKDVALPYAFAIKLAEDGFEHSLVSEG